MKLFFSPNTPASPLKNKRVEVLCQPEPVEHHQKSDNQLKRDSFQFSLRMGFRVPV